MQVITAPENSRIIQLVEQDYKALIVILHRVGNNMPIDDDLRRIASLMAKNL